MKQFQQFQRPAARFGLTFGDVARLVSGGIPGSRIMYDAIGVNAFKLVPFHPQLVLGYDTGSTDIKWQPEDWNLFPGIPHVDTDQAGLGAPVHSAIVMDIEPAAYRPADVPGWMAAATAERPTAYVDRIDCDTILADGFTRDIILAWPNWNGEALPGAPGQVVAVQNTFLPDHDESVVLDPYWPFRSPAKEKEMLSGTVAALGDDFVPFPAGSFKQIMLYRDITTHPVSVRVAVHSASKGYTQIADPLFIHDSVPHTLTFADTDVNGVSLSGASAQFGWTLS